MASKPTASYKSAVEAQKEILYDRIFTPKVEQRLVERIKSFLLARKQLDIGLTKANTELFLATSCLGILSYIGQANLVEEDYFREKIAMMKERCKTYKWLPDLKELNITGSDVYFDTTAENWAHIITLKPLARDYVKYSDLAMQPLANCFDVEHADVYIRCDWDDFDELDSMMIKKKSF